jgi:hypothetical protein
LGKFYRSLGDELRTVVRSIAWLNAVPVSDNKTLKERLTRRESFEARGEEINLPECSLPFMVGYFMEVGPVVSTGMGPAPISWQDLLAWQSCIGVCLPPWQLRMLVGMSQEYVSFSRKAEKPDCPAPWVEEMDDDRRLSIARRLKMGFKSMIGMHR